MSEHLVSSSRLERITPELAWTNKTWGVFLEGDVRPWVRKNPLWWKDESLKLLLYVILPISAFFFFTLNISEIFKLLPTEITSYTPYINQVLLLIITVAFTSFTLGKRRSTEDLKWIEISLAKLESLPWEKRGIREKCDRMRANNQRIEFKIFCLPPAYASVEERAPLCITLYEAGADIRYEPPLVVIYRSELIEPLATI